MAKATKKATKPGKAEKLKELKAPKDKQPKGKPGSPKNPIPFVPEQNGDDSEPLSEFQTPKTGRTIDDLAIVNGIEIDYVKVQSETDFLELRATDKNQKLPKEIQDVFKVPVHKNLKKAIQRLRVHAILLVEYLNPFTTKKLSDIPKELIESYNITSVHFKSAKRGDSIQINATLTTSRGKAFNFTTPIEYLFEDGETAYPFSKDLINIRQEIFMRVGKYLSGEERGDVNAIGMFAEAKEITEEQIMTNGQENDVTDKYKMPGRPFTEHESA